MVGKSESAGDVGTGSSDFQQVDDVAVAILRSSFMMWAMVTGRDGWGKQTVGITKSWLQNHEAAEAKKLCR